MVFRKILVTGATGFIGRHVTSYLLEKGHSVRALVRTTNAALKPRDGLSLAKGNMKDYQSLLEATRDIYAVIHLAAAKSDEKDSYATNVIGMENLVRACEANNVELIINVSTASTKISKKGLYAKTKRDAEVLLQNSPIHSVILRPSIVYGDLKNGIFGSLVKFASLPLVPIIGSGETTFRPIHVDDLAQTIEIAILNSKIWGKSYDVGGPDEITLNALVKKIALKILQKDSLKLIHVPTSLGIFLARTLSLFFNKPPITASNILGSTQSAFLDVFTYFKDFNFLPRRLELGLREMSKTSFSEDDEQKLIYSYLTSTLPLYFKIDNVEKKDYFQALDANNLSRMSLQPIFYRFPSLLGPIDAISKIKYPSGTLQSKLAIATALVECHTSSAKWLLPSNNSLLSLITKSANLISRSIFKLVIGTLLLTIPRFVQRNAK